MLGKFNQTGRWSENFLATKSGMSNPGGNPQDGAILHPSHICRTVLRSLFTLKTDHIDLYYQHPVDPKVPIEMVLETVRELVDNSQIKYLGFSECNAKTSKRAKAVKGMGDKIVAVQMEYSPFTLDIEENGISA